MGNFFYRLEKFVVNLLIVLLILLVSVQFLMKNEDAYQRFKELELSLRGLIGQKPLEETVPVSNLTPEPVAFLTIDLLQDLSLPQVWLLVNGERVANFARGIVRLEVKEGDILTIDASFYSEALWFEITALSPEILSFYQGQQFRIKGQAMNLGTVLFSDRL